MKRGFTILEFLITIAIIAIIAVAMIVLINPFAQFEKAKDARRKHDLELLQKAFEDYYNDTGCYPRAEDVCAPSGIQNACTGSIHTVDSKICKICGTDPNTPSTLLKYIKTIPCDPDSNSYYLYRAQYPSTPNQSGYADPNGYNDNSKQCANITPPVNYCPGWYKLYTNLAATSSSGGYDKESAVEGCLAGGCGMSRAFGSYPEYGFDYGVSSANVVVDSSHDYTCIDAGNRCTRCVSYDQCLSNSYSCDSKKVYATGTACCQANPSAPGC